MGSKVMEKRLNSEQLKVGMYVKLLDDISRNLNRCLFENKSKKKTLSELQAVSQKSCFAVRQMADKVKEGFLTEEELEKLQQIEAEINYEVLIGKIEKKFRWEYTKNLVEFLQVLSDSILKRTGIEKESWYV